MHEPMDTSCVVTGAGRGIGSRDRRADGAPRSPRRRDRRRRRGRCGHGGRDRCRRGHRARTSAIPSRTGSSPRRPAPRRTHRVVQQRRRRRRRPAVRADRGAGTPPRRRQPPRLHVGHPRRPRRRSDPAAATSSNTASIAGLGPVPGYSVYAATKAAVVSLHHVGGGARGRRSPRAVPRRGRPRCSRPAATASATDRACAILTVDRWPVRRRTGRIASAAAVRRRGGLVRRQAWLLGLVARAARMARDPVVGDAGSRAGRRLSTASVPGARR